MLGGRRLTLGRSRGTLGRGSTSAAATCEAIDDAEPATGRRISVAARHNREKPPMSDPILYIDRSRIRAGRLPELRVAMQALADFIEEHNPYVLSYRFFLDEDEGEMTVVAEHPDSAALVHHMDVGDEEFRKFGALLELQSISVFGSVDDAVLARLHAKAGYLGGTVSVHRRQAGFTRDGRG